ncbi:tail sheath protein [Xylanimonas cellulosilytica DSM 15894]|uniref:Tail sheath protein n=1 Tax=Xylanimonas cellulosilytica (strain DSM 15894 / JCM 12276 / CECT 5975 / KCTC 9989 / LMG 20990 / NBRC 107835 / XIL07) TaxID=446471 RepID=D1BTJ8_XYLCX|nr:phage tail sheath C-terminal domain-containing protein [Xylanimonas cellulosilytica]ACZ30977.1 tail sheath protein [Xylanimonas cellulosilytica DSM 15894]
MVFALRTPGAYYERVDAGGELVSPLRTDVTGFVGIAERGPLDLPVPVESWRQFVSWFGDVSPAGFLGYAVRGFFANGGQRAWVVRVASRDAAAGAACAGTGLVSAAGQVWRLRASSEGTWGNGLTASLREVNRVQRRSVAGDAAGRWTAVASVAGVARGLHVRLSQPGRVPQHRVVSAVDPVTGRVYWVHPQGEGLPYDAPVMGLDPDVPVLLEGVEWRLVVSENDVLVAVYDQLSLVPENERYGPRVLAAPRGPVDPVTRVQAWTPPQPVVLEELRATTADLTPFEPAGTDRLELAGGRAGLAALMPQDFFGEPVATSDSREAAALKLRGMRTLEEIGEIGLLAVPDAFVRPEVPNPVVPPEPVEPDPCRGSCPPCDDVGGSYGSEPHDLVPGTARPVPFDDLPPVFTDQQSYLVQAQLVNQCERLRYRFALLDPPWAAATDAAGGTSAVLDWRARFDSPRAALSYPWLGVLDPLTPAGGNVRLVPPSGHVAGAYAATDLAVGVHRAAAGSVLDWTLRASVDVDAERHGVLNDAGVNVARTVAGRGLRLLGARTCSSDPDWRYVPVRRLLSMIEKALELALQWVVFEPNGMLTRARVTMTATMLLLGLHESGALAGATPDESFRVVSDPDNNPPQVTDRGELVVDVLVAPVLPLEFVLVRVGRVGDSLVVRSDAVPAGALTGGAP